MTETAGSIAAMEAVNKESLRQLLHLADGQLPGEFLRLQGINARELVVKGLLRVDPGRWSDSYVAGPLLRSSQAKE